MNELGHDFSPLGYWSAWLSETNPAARISGMTNVIQSGMMMSIQQYGNEHIDIIMSMPIYGDT
jgi:hypothetical protein